MKNILELHNLSVGYTQKRQQKVVVSDINVRLDKGELVCLLGPNGAGKSTLMKTISGAQPPLSGEVLFQGENLHSMSVKMLAKKLSLVLTERIQAGMLTAYEVVALGRYPHTNWSGKMTSNDHDIIKWSLEMTSASFLANRPFSELSDGERQKVMVARAVAQEPEVMILDEVTAFLDLPRRVEIMQLLKRLAHSEGKAILLSTHDMDLALRNADSLWLLPNNGKLLNGAPEDLVLYGSIERAFNSKGVSFNRENGAFQTSVASDQFVNLQGDGEAAIWTRRALGRIGVSIDTNAPISIKVSENDGVLHWVLTNNEEAKSYSTLYQLIKGMKEMHQSS